MTTFFKPFDASDITTTVHKTHEQIPITGSILTGTYDDANIKYFTHDPQIFWNEFGGQKYFDKFHGSDPRNEDKFLQVIEKYKPKNIIDIGCGYGRYLKAINEVYPEIQLFGVDIAESQINIAKEFLSDCKNLSLTVTENNKLPFIDNSIDMAITYGCFSAVKKKNLISCIYYRVDSL